MAATSELLIKIRDQDKEEVVVDTCKLAVERLEWIKEAQNQESDKLSKNPYESTDPAPPSLEDNHEKLEAQLLNEDLDKCRCPQLHKKYH